MGRCRCRLDSTGDKKLDYALRIIAGLFTLASCGCYLALIAIPERYGRPQDESKLGDSATTNSIAALHLLYATCAGGECSSGVKDAMCTPEIKGIGKYGFTCPPEYCNEEHLGLHDAKCWSKDMLCNRFEMVPKPLTFVWLSATVNTAWALTMSSGKVGLPSLVFAFVQAMCAFTDLFFIALKVTRTNSIEMFPTEHEDRQQDCFPGGHPTTWQERVDWNARDTPDGVRCYSSGELHRNNFELVYYLAAQSSITLKVAAFGLASAIYNKAKNRVGTATEGDGRKKCCDMGDYSVLMDKLRRGVFAGWIMGFLPAVIYFYIPATAMWFWLLPFWLVVGGVCGLMSTLIAKLFVVVVNKIRARIGKGPLNFEPGDVLGLITLYMAFVIYVQVYISYAILYYNHGKTSDAYIKAIADEFYSRSFRQYFACFSPDHPLSLFDNILMYS